MTPFDLNAELSAGVETPLHEVDVETINSGTEIERQLAESSKNAQAKAVPKKAVALIRRAVAMMDDGPEAAAKAAKLLIKAIEIDESFALSHHAMAICLEKLGRLSAALSFYETAWKLNPGDAEIYMNLGLVAWKLDMLEGAEKFLRLFVKMSPEHPNGIINLSGLLRDQGKYEDSIEILRAAIYADPERATYWNSLGSSVLESGDPEQSLTFFEESARLDPDLGRAYHNMAFAYELLGMPERSTELFDQAMAGSENACDKVMMQYGQAQSLLAKGDLKAGWDMYQARLDKNYRNSVMFLVDAPKWEGVDLSEIKGKRLLWIGEQGLGDEVMFLQMAKDLQEAIGPDGELRIAVERRLMNFVSSVVPEAKIGYHVTAARDGQTYRMVKGFDDMEPVDLWAPLAQPARSLRLSARDFNREAYYQPDPQRVAHWREHLKQAGTGLKVGILWKSLKMNAQRSKSFSPFENWKPVLTTPGVDFINLQYGETTEDIAYAKDAFGVDIFTPEGIDLKDDLDEVANLSAAVDLIVGPGNATTSLAGAGGAELWLTYPHKNPWPLLGAGELIWYPNTRSFFPKSYGNWPDIFKQVNAALIERVEARKAA